MTVGGATALAAGIYTTRFVFFYLRLVYVCAKSITMSNVNCVKKEYCGCLGYLLCKRRRYVGIFSAQFCIFFITQEDLDQGLTWFNGTVRG